MNSNIEKKSIRGVVGSLFKNDVIRTFAILLALIIFLVIARPGTFVTADNFWSTLSQVSVNAILVMGLFLAILTGGINISIGSVAAFSSLITAMMLVSNNAFSSNVVVAVSVGLIVGALVGVFIGFFVAELNLQPYIVTLAAQIIFRGLTMVVSQGQPTSNLGEAFSYIGFKSIGPVPVNVIIMVVLFLIFYYFLEHRRFGRYLYAIGDNKEAARLSGIQVKKDLYIVYLLGGVMSAVAGMVLASRVNSATPIAGTGAEMDAIAAAVIGGASLKGGKGTILGALLGAIIIGVLNNGLVLLGVDVYWTQVVKGLIILVAVSADAISSKRAAKA
ncbi:MAG: ABC transporter permease [Fastidiosipilaceae bacterium]|jgi:ribose transport system permease protein